MKFSRAFFISGYRSYFDSMIVHCPGCGGPLLVADYSGSRYVRKHECVECGHRFQVGRVERLPVEVVQAALERWSEEWEYEGEEDGYYFRVVSDDEIDFPCRVFGRRSWKFSPLAEYMLCWAGN